MHSAATTNRTAGIQNELSVPKAAIDSAPMRGPRVKPRANSPSYTPLSSSRLIFAAAATSGIIDFRAVYPAGSITAPKTASARIRLKVKSVKRANTGKATTEIAEAKSVIILSWRLPNRSTAYPTSGVTKSAGRAESAATIPAAEARPVLFNTSQGIVTMTIPLPTDEAMFALCSKTTWRVKYCFAAN